MSTTENNTNAKAKQPVRHFYDPAKIKEIPIIEVCEHFGIQINYLGREPKCSIRREDKTPSTVLHIDPRGRYKENTYHDFGANESGDVISLACRLLELDRSQKEDRYKAMEYLANAFHIAPENNKEKDPGELTDREWALLGLYGDRATKNFSFGTDPDQNAAIAKKYGMSMNELKKAHPRTYERLIKTIAIPNLQEARNSYYMDLWTARRFLRSVLGENAALIPQKEQEQTAAELRSMERALNRAITGTRMDALPAHEYDPDKVLARIDAGELKPNFGAKTKNQMDRLAKACNTTVKYRTLQLNPVLYEGDSLFGDFPYSAFMSNGNAVVGYLERDHQALRSIFEELSLPKERPPRKRERTQREQPLDAKLKSANERQAAQAAQAGATHNTSEHHR